MGLILALEYSPQFKQSVAFCNLFTLGDGHAFEELIMASIARSIPFKPTALEDGNKFIERAFPRPFAVNHKSDISREAVLMKGLP